MYKEGYIIALLTINKKECLKILYYKESYLIPYIDQASIFNTLKDATDQVDYLNRKTQQWYEWYENNKLRIIDIKILQIRTIPKIIKTYNTRGEEQTPYYDIYTKEEE